jgi:Na+-transporting NADH:ubiquinone oxidoreductase subunit NqrF
MQFAATCILPEGTPTPRMLCAAQDLVSSRASGVAIRGRCRVRLNEGGQSAAAADVDHLNRRGDDLNVGDRRAERVDTAGLTDFYRTKLRRELFGEPAFLR